MNNTASTISPISAEDGRNRLSITSGSSRDADISNEDRELTPGSLDVWVELPDEIKYDPLLAPFKQRYEQQHGKIEQADNEGDRNIFHKPPKQMNGETLQDGIVRLMEPMPPEDEKKARSVRKKTINRTLRAVKLTGLVACWVMLTVSLLMNSETSDVILHTAVIGGQVKEYELPPTDDRVKVHVAVTGPFEQKTNESSGNFIQLWLQRKYGENNINIQESSRWSIQLPSEAMIDFSPSASESQTLSLQEFSKETSYNSSENQTFGWAGTNGTKVSLCINATSNSIVPLTLSYQLNPLSYEDGLVYATVLLLILYMLIIFEIVNRTLAALLSSSLSVAALAWSSARPSLGELVSWLDVETLLLLFSMMLLVAILGETGLFDWLAVAAFEVTGGRTWPLINCLCLFTAVFSTFLDNVTTVLLMTPVTIRLCEVMELNPVPVLMSMVIFSNVGGAATPVGDPPNVIIATHPAILGEMMELNPVPVLMSMVIFSNVEGAATPVGDPPNVIFATHPAILGEGINFTSFTLHMGLGILLVSIQTYLQLRYMFRDINTLRHNVPRDIQEMRQVIAVWRRAAASLSSYSRDEDLVRRALEKKVDKVSAALARREARGGPSKSDPMFCSTLASMKEKYRIRDKPLLVKAIVCVSFVVVVFFLHAIPELQRLSLGWSALLGALLLLLLAEKEDLEPVLARVEWSTLLFFAALFVLMEALSKLGLIEWIGNVTEALIMRVGEESRLAVALMLVLWVSGLASAFVDNIPLTTMMVRVIVALSAPPLALPLAPLAWALSFGACLGGNGTLIGASANVVCAGVAEQHGYRFTFVQFLRTGFPVMLGNLLVATAYLMVCHVAFQWH